MKHTLSYLITALVLVLSWGIPVFGIIRNRLDPTPMSALNVPYGFLAGCIIHVILLVAWIGIRRAQLSRGEGALLGVSIVVMLVLTLLAEGGGLSKAAP